MARKRQLDADGVERAKALRLAGRTYREIATVLGCSVGVVSKAISGAYDVDPEAHESDSADAAASQAPRVAGARPSRVRAPSGPAAEPKPPAEPMTPAEMLEDARQRYATLSRDAEDARTAGRTGEYLSIARMLPQLLAQIDKLTPPAPPNHDEAPDMVAAAKRCRRKHHELMTKLLDEYHAKKGTPE